MSETIRAFIAYELSDRDARVPAYYIDALKALDMERMSRALVTSLWKS